MSANGILSTCKSTGLTLINFSYHAQNTVWRTFTETAINLTLSLSLVKHLGIVGVLIGTGIALLWRLIDITIYSNHKILEKSVWLSMKLYLINFGMFSIITVASTVIDITADGYGELIFVAAVSCLAVGALFVAVNWIMFPKQFKFIKNILLRGKKT